MSNALLDNANSSGADARGATFSQALPMSAITTNLIQSNGHIAGLDLTGGNRLVVRDYNGNPNGPLPTGPLPIVVEEHFTMDATGTLRLVFGSDPWDSTISFAPSIPVTLGGKLELAFADDVLVGTQIGRTIHLFDWTGVTPSGKFTVSSPYIWNLSQLYTTGHVKLQFAPFEVTSFNRASSVHRMDSVPEPSSITLLLLAASFFLLRSRSASTRAHLCFLGEICVGKFGAELSSRG